MSRCTHVRCLMFQISVGAKVFSEGRDILLRITNLAIHCPEKFREETRDEISELAG